ncbi:hypothetical protein O181_047834, partial [Austropuccinia psidii MF-1]|nr:hypothetical protein [Austropuccinia psidii MF-1]
MKIANLCLNFSFSIILHVYLASSSSQWRLNENTIQSKAPLNQSLIIAQTSCQKRPLKIQLWQDLQLDSYLREYIGGKTLSVKAFANKVNMTDFACGIGQPCDAGEWTDFALLLSSLQDQVQQRIANYTLTVLQAGISTNEGLFGTLKGGGFLESPKQASIVELESTFRNIVKVQLLAGILRAQNVYITRGSDKCNKEGPNGSFQGPDVLSYCDKYGVMMNIVQARGSKTIMKFRGSAKITQKYNFSVEFLTESAWKCQSKYKIYDYNPYQNSTFPQDLNADCLFNLPVCDCTQE